MVSLMRLTPHLQVMFGGSTQFSTPGPLPGIPPLEQRVAKMRQAFPEGADRIVSVPIPPMRDMHDN